MSKVDIISGFLGAGKTTLIKKLIKESFNDEKIVLIENEFGEIGIDGSFLKDAGIEIKEMNSGCICCSLVGDFSEALVQVVETYHPQRIIIEPSGVGKLSDVIKAVESVHNSELALNSFVSVVDSKKCKIYKKNFGEFFDNQIEYASTIILSRTQNLKNEELDEVVKLIKEDNHSAHLITTPWDELKGNDILKVMENEDDLKTALLKEAKVCQECGHIHEDGEHHHHHEHEHHHEHDHHHDHHHHHADEIFNSVGFESAKVFSKNQLQKILLELSKEENILRAKGVLKGDDSWYHFDVVPNEVEIREGCADYNGRICVIGKDVSEEAIKKVFGE